MSPSFRFVAAFVRIWTRLYTWRMEPAVAAARRDEIDSDLWESQHDPIGNGLHPALHVLARLIAGMPSDLRWRVEQITADEWLPTRAALAGAVIAAAALWIVPAWLSRGESSRRTQFDECASAFEATVGGSLTRADYRTGVMTCAGAFFARGTPAAGSQPTNRNQQ